MVERVPGASISAGQQGNLEVAVQYSGPAVLPWLWQPVEIDGDVVLVPQPIPHTAGPSGEQLELTPHANDPMQMNALHGLAA